MARQSDDLPWQCQICRQKLRNYADGVSLTDTDEIHVCIKCWLQLSPVERLEAVRRWRLDSVATHLLQELTDLARAAGNGWHYPGLGGSERN